MRRLFVLLLLLAAPARAQQPRDTFLDPGARQLLERARGFRLVADSSISSYTAVVRSRIAAGLRAMLKDRTIFREESASRVRWSRDGETVAQLLAAREQNPGRTGLPEHLASSAVSNLFDPGKDHMLFALERGDSANSDEEIWIENPLADSGFAFYRYQSGDTITMRLEDGRILQSIELRVLPRERSPHAVAGSLWIDASNGAVSQAVYRMARPLDLEKDGALDPDDREDMKKIPGLFKPFEFDLSLVVIEYSLWEFKYWLPRFMRMEGSMRAGFIHAPATFEISYELEDVVSNPVRSAEKEALLADSVARAWSDTSTVTSKLTRDRGKTFRVIVPRDSMKLATSPDLPPPVWASAPEFASETELRSMFEQLTELAVPSSADAVRPQFTWGPGGADLLRYNRVEGLSVGARGTVSLPYVDAAATARLGFGDWHPNAELQLTRVGSARTLRLQLAHGLTPFDPAADNLGVGASTSALLLGRDDGEYFRATGARLALLPGRGRRPSYEAGVYLQHERAVHTEIDASLPRLWNSDFRFRRVIPADAADLAGVTLALRPWWGTDPQAAQAGLELNGEAATGDYRFGRLSATLRSALPITSKMRAGLELGAGTATGTVPVQRWFLLGGPATLRGYPGSTTGGTSFARGRAELARTFGWGGLSVFGDAGWAGDRHDYATAKPLLSTGVGFSVLDGLVRFDLARALRAPTGWRLELYLDALL